MAQYKGKVKWFNNAKGYGYKTLKEGDDVEFDIAQGQKGPQAEAVIRLRDAAHDAHNAA